MLVVVVGMRAGAVGVILFVIAGCSINEPSAPALAAAGAANLKSARTTHIEGTGSFAVKDALSMSFDFKLSGDAELPDKTRMRVQITSLGTALSLETISIAGRSYVKDGSSGHWSERSSGAPLSASVDPFSTVDLSAIRDVIEVDRPVVDGRKTRHLRYFTDSTKLLEAMQLAAVSGSPSVAYPQGSGELWIRVDDSQIVRQRVRVSYELSGLPDVVSSSGSGRATIEILMDTRFSRHGEPVPTISPPPTR